MKHKTIAFRWTWAGLAFFALGAAQADDLGRCYSADIESAVVLPDGVERAPGRVRVCTTAHFTPATTLHKVYWNGALIGLFQARHDEQEAVALGVDTTVFAFTRRHGTERLVLVGFATVDGARARTYDLAPRSRVTSSWWLGPSEAARSPSSDRVLVAANIR
jgi:hypothetical protein